MYIYTWNMKYKIIYDSCTERTSALWTPFLNMYDIKYHLIYEHIWIQKPIKLQLKNADIFINKQLEDDSKPIIQIPKKNELSVLQKQVWNY